ncbi:MAG: exodeoxyribonuclease V subunit gamma, partial [Bacteroidetes bacterium]|nr:exodeoxyribonuclease V subunit gamma [Bacteroidota bacterium]
MNFIEDLNSRQKEAVLYNGGPSMVIAGAGSGKTRVLTYRIAYHISTGVDPFNILALTFTNKAAKEMRSRVEKLIGREARNLWIGTFHSIFARILRIEADKLSYPSNFSIYDAGDSKSLVRLIIKEMQLDDKNYKASVVLKRISLAKNNLISVEEYLNSPVYREEDERYRKPELGNIYKTYQQRCFKASAMDFDDLLFNTYKLFQDFPEALHKYQNKFHYVLLDEFQDTNHAQYLITRKLAESPPLAPPRGGTGQPLSPTEGKRDGKAPPSGGMGGAGRGAGIFVVGDDAQSIYAFRGADINNMLSFEKDYPDLKIFKLEQNYRSTKNIVEAANSVIINNKDQLPKKLWTDNNEGDLINVLKAGSDNEEGKLVANSIFEEKVRGQLKNSNFAILYRTNAQSRAMEEALRRINIKYKIVGGLSFYQRKEIKDILAYLRFTVNHNDEEALRRIINYPRRGIGDTTMSKLLVLADENQRPLWEIISNISEAGMSERITHAIEGFATLIKSFVLINNANNAFKTTEKIAKSSGLLKELYEDKTVEGLSKYENIQELLNAIKEFVDNADNTLKGEGDGKVSSLLGDGRGADLGCFLQEISLLTDADTGNEEDADRVTLMTIHAAKGLEFRNVYVVGLEEDLFPSQMMLNSRADLEEERRLFYVALTRSEKKLTLSYAEYRYRYGNLHVCKPSRFLDEIDPKYLESKFQNTNYELQIN